MLQNAQMTTNNDYSCYVGTIWWVEDCDGAKRRPQTDTVAVVKIISIDGDRATVERLSVSREFSVTNNALVFVPAAPIVPLQTHLFRFHRLLPHLPLMLLGTRRKGQKKQVPFKEWDGAPIYLFQDGYDVKARVPF